MKVARFEAEAARRCLAMTPQAYGRAKFACTPQRNRQFVSHADSFRMVRPKLIRKPIERGEKLQYPIRMSGVRHRIT
jgi:hypothetical protein